MALGTPGDAVMMSIVLVNTNLAAAAGIMTFLLVSQFVLRRIDLFAGLNGAIAGLVSITAAPDIVTPYWSIIIGGIGGALCTFVIKLMEKVKLDDVVGAIPAHLIAGIWGTLAACIAGGGQILVQLIGMGAIGAFVFGLSWLAWRGLDLVLGVRVSYNVERLGQDSGELRIEAYPEFVLMPEDFDED